MSNEVKKITLGLIISWVFGILFGLSSISLIIGGSLVNGLVYLLIALILLPPANKIMNDRYNFQLSRGLKITLVIMLLIFMDMGIVKSNDVDTDVSATTLIAKMPDEMMPNKAEIPTEFTRGDLQNVSLNVTGFESGIMRSTVKETDNWDITVDYFIYKFSTTEYAKSWYTTRVNDVKERGGYKEISIPNCFAYKEEYERDWEEGATICLKANIVYIIEASADGTSKSIDGFMEDAKSLLSKNIK